MKPSEIGGQAVLEGVMMKNKNQYAIAVRKPDNEIIVEKKEYIEIAERISFFGLPIIRGIVKFIESLTLGIKIMTFSASFYEEDDSTKKNDVKESKKDASEKADAGKKGLPEGVMNTITVILAVVLAVGIFMVLPYLISQLLNKFIESQKILTLFEGVVRIVLFVGYISAISLMDDIKRVFMYHGAEHKVINCIENGYNLTVENVKKQSRQHKRCGTSFSLYVIFLSVIFFMFINLSSPVLRLLLRLILVPVIAGVSYELIKLAGRSDNKFVNIISKPGFLLQSLTTKEPDKGMIEVAIASVEAVFDWKAFLSESRKETKDVKSRKKKKTTDTKLKKLETIMTNQEDELNNLDKVLDIEDVKKNKVKPESSLVKRSASFEPGLAASKEDEEDEVLMALDKYFVFGKEDKDGED